jgi:hypothetical protein
MKGMQLQGNQTLIVIHAEDGVPFAVHGVMKNRIGGKGAPKGCGLRIAGCASQFLQRREDHIRLFCSDSAGLAGMRIEAGNSDARIGQAQLAKKVFEKETDSDDLFAAQRSRHFAQRNVRGDESNGQSPARQQHGEIAHIGAIGEKLSLARKLEADLIHARFVDRAGDNGVDFAAERELDSLFQSVQGGPSRFWSWLA